MATCSVPGYNGEGSDSSTDILRAGCWAESKDNCLILVEDITDDMVIYTVFDLNSAPITEMRSRMNQDEFKEFYSHGSHSNKVIDGNNWKWHDKTKFTIDQFPWDRIIENSDSNSSAKKISQYLDQSLIPVKKEDVQQRISKISFTGKMVRKLKHLLDGWDF